ncbi:endonuclease [Candidatus Bathyarchaeota archaeon]|nr:endonuclease [Candidatus Bathyarchaeota archaeon]
MAKEFRIATFNLENLDDRDRKGFEKRKKVLRPMMERINADLLLLQEVNTLTALENLIKGLKKYENYDEKHTTRNGARYPRRNLVILSRYPIKEKHQYHHTHVKNPMWRKVTSKPPETRAKKIRWERPILHCEIELPGNRILHAINLHLKSKNPTSIEGQQDKKKYWLWLSHEGWAEGYFLSSVKRVGQALETRILIEELLRRDPFGTLIALGGDINADIGSVPFKILVGSVTDTSNPELRRTVMVPCEYNVPPEQRYSHLYHGDGAMLNHIIVSNALYPHWVGTQIFNELLPDESIAFASDIKFPESDHAPVVARFESPENWA